MVPINGIRRFYVNYLTDFFLVKLCGFPTTKRFFLAVRLKRSQHLLGSTVSFMLFEHLRKVCRCNAFVQITRFMMTRLPMQAITRLLECQQKHKSSQQSDVAAKYFRSVFRKSIKWSQLAVEIFWLLLLFLPLFSLCRCMEKPFSIPALNK